MPARTSATRSTSGVSCSWPIADTTGVEHAATARHQPLVRERQQILDAAAAAGEHDHVDLAGRDRAGQRGQRSAAPRRRPARPPRRPGTAPAGSGAWRSRPRRAWRRRRCRRSARSCAAAAAAAACARRRTAPPRPARAAAPRSGAAAGPARTARSPLDRRSRSSPRLCVQLGRARARARGRPAPAAAARASSRARGHHRRQRRRRRRDPSASGRRTPSGCCASARRPRPRPTPRGSRCSQPRHAQVEPGHGVDAAVAVAGVGWGFALMPEVSPRRAPDAGQVRIRAAMCGAQPRSSIVHGARAGRRRACAIRSATLSGYPACSSTCSRHASTSAAACPRAARSACNAVIGRW